MHSRFFLRALVVVAMFSSLGACRSTSAPSNLYLLTPTTDGKPLTTPHPFHLRITELVLPEYLATQAMLLRTTPQRLEIQESERWAAPLHDTFTRVLMQDLSALLPDSRVTRFSWEDSSEERVSLFLNVLRFDVGNGTAILDAQWRLLDGSGMQTLHSSHHERKVESGTFGARAMALSRTVADLGRGIATALATGATQKIEADSRD